MRTLLLVFAVTESLAAAWTYGNPYHLTYCESIGNSHECRDFAGLPMVVAALKPLAAGINMLGTQLKLKPYRFGRVLKRIEHMQAC